MIGLEITRHVTKGKHSESRHGGIFRDEQFQKGSSSNFSDLPFMVVCINLNLYYL